jgi:hypothetical protein
MVLLLVLVSWSIAPLIALLLYAAHRGGTFTGVYGPFLVDQLQYLAWIRDSGQHLLASNLFDVVPSSHVFLHPMFLLSGAAWRMGLSPQVAYMLWLPVAILALFSGFLAYVHRMVSPGRWQRPAALALALFFVTPTAALAHWLHPSGTRVRDLILVAGEMFPAAQAHGYLPTVIAIGLMPLFLLGIERILDPGRLQSGRSATWYVTWTAIAGLIVAWLHPWQGEVLLVIVAALIGWARLGRRSLAIAIPAVATAAPIAYYYLLSRIDPAWRIAQRQNEVPHFAVAALIIGLLPLVLAALPGFWRGTLDLQTRMVRVWPVAAIVVYLWFSPSFPAHALEGISLPLAVLAVQAWRRLPLALALIGVAVLILPGLGDMTNLLRQSVASRQQPYILTSQERSALAALDRMGGSGGVLADTYLGPAIPALTGHQTWVGHPSWTPDFGSRAGAVTALFDGQLPQTQARTLVQQSGARFVLADCPKRADLSEMLGNQVVGETHFGCVTVYKLRAQQSR